MNVTFSLNDPPDEGHRFFLLLYVDVAAARLAAGEPEHAEHAIAAAMRRALDQHLAGRAILDQIHAVSAAHQQETSGERLSQANPSQAKSWESWRRAASDEPDEAPATPRPPLTTPRSDGRLITIAAAAARFIATANAEASGHTCAPTAQECCRDLSDALRAAGIDPLQFIRFYPQEEPA